MITTTITTIGYGDYKAFNDNHAVWLPEMCYLYFVTLLGIFLFTTVTHQIFNYEQLKTVNEIVKKTVTSMEEYMYDISKARKDRFLGLDVIEESLEHMEEFIRCSTRFHFENSHFY